MKNSAKINKKYNDKFFSVGAGLELPSDGMTYISQDMLDEIEFNGIIPNKNHPKHVDTQDNLDQKVYDPKRLNGNQEINTRSLVDKFNKPIMINKNLMNEIFVDFDGKQYNISTINPSLQFFIDESKVFSELNVPLVRYTVMTLDSVNIESDETRSLVYVRDTIANVNSYFIKNTSENINLMNKYAKILQIINNYCHIIKK